MHFLKISHLLVLILFFVYTRSQTNEKSVGVKHENILFNLKGLIPITLRKKDFVTGEISKINFTVSTQTLDDYNLTKEFVQQGLFQQVNDTDAEVVLPNGFTIPIHVKTDQVVVFTNKKGISKFRMSKYGFYSRNMETIKDDPSLQSLKDFKMEWKLPKLCSLSQLRILVTSNSVELISQNNVVYSNRILRKSKSRHWWKDYGIVLAAVNPSTCDVTFADLFLTNDFGYFRDLVWALDSISAGRIVVFMSLRDGSLLLSEARERLLNYGSMWGDHYLFQDGWMGAFVKGGKTLNEVWIPNLFNNASGSPSYRAEMSIDLSTSFNQSNAVQDCYSGWPNSEDWISRRIFCSLHDGYGDLCSCENPFVLKSSKANKKSDDGIVFVILAGNRTRHLNRLIFSLGSQADVFKENVMLSVDGMHEKTIQLAEILGLNYLLHKVKNISGKARVSNNLRFGLYNAHQLYSNGKYFVVIEDDLILARDFHSYMKHFSPIFELDKSIFAVSAFNHLSYPHTSQDPGKVYRVHTVPSLGWMISRKILEFIVPKLLPQKIDQDWDYFLESELVLGNREILIPDVNRSYHPSLSGLHVKGSALTEFMYLRRNLNNRTNVTMVPLDRIVKQKYEEEYLELIKKARTIGIVDKPSFNEQMKKGGTYKMFVKKQKKFDEDAFRFIGDFLDIWSEDARDQHHHSWRMNYFNSTLFVIGIPISPYSKYRPINSSYVIPQGEDMRDLDESYEEKYQSISMKTHARNTNFPDFYYKL